MWPGASIVAGTAWQAVHMIGAEICACACKWAWCAPTPSAVVNVLPDRSTGGAADCVPPWQPLQPGTRPTATVPVMCPALGGWQVAQSVRA